MLKNLLFLCGVISQARSGQVKCRRVLRRGLRQATDQVVRSSRFMQQCSGCVTPCMHGVMQCNVKYSSKSPAWDLSSVYGCSNSGLLVNILLYIFSLFFNR